MSFNEGMIHYAADMAKRYLADKRHVISLLQFKSITGMLNVTYKMLVAKKEIDPIESLPEEEKQGYWEQSKLLSEDKDFRIRICEALYLLDKLTV